MMNLAPPRFCSCFLALLLLPAMAFGQTAVSCEECSHYVSIRKGEGGFVAQVDGDAEEVIWVDSCGGITRSGSLEPNEDGVVAGLYEACSAEGGELQLGPVMDGGWFWITDDMNSAVGGLVDKDVYMALMDDTVDITGAGDGVEMEVGKGAVWLRETATGRVGILPNILPEAPEAPAEVCGPRRNPSPPHAWDRQRTTNCVLGAGRTRIRVVGPDATGNMVEYANGMVYRPASGEITYIVDIWLDESGGSFSTATDGAGGAPSAASIQRGWLGKAATATLGSEPNQLRAFWSDGQGGSVDLLGGPGRQDLPNHPTNRRDGLAWERPDSLQFPERWGRIRFFVGANSDYCSATADHTAVVEFTPAYQESGSLRNNVHPPLAQGKAAGSDVADGRLGKLRLRVVCPPSRP